MREKYLVHQENVPVYEPVIRRFVLGLCDSVRLTNRVIIGISLRGIRKELSPEHDARFRAVLENLKKYEIRKHTVKKGVCTYYLYRLSSELRRTLNKESLVWIDFNPSEVYGLEDPVFYKGKDKILEVISHEPIFYLYLTPREKKQLGSKGVVFQRRGRDV